MGRTRWGRRDSDVVIWEVAELIFVGFLTTFVVDDRRGTISDSVFVIPLNPGPELGETEVNLNTEYDGPVLLPAFAFFRCSDSRQLG